LTRDTNYSAVEVLAEELPWLQWLPEQERSECVAELLRYLAAGADTGPSLPLSQALTSWRSTAEVWNDPALTRRLQGPFDGDGPYIERPMADR